MNLIKKSSSQEDKKDKEKPVETKGVVLKADEVPNNEERDGIIPEGMDFKKFIGCGG